MTPREIIQANIACRCADRIGLNFSGAGRHNDFAFVGVQHDLTTRKWVEGELEYSVDIWGNTWHRKVGMSQGGEICAPALPTWDALASLTLPDLTRPEFYQPARDLAAGASDKFRCGFLPGWPFSICRYLRKMEVYFLDMAEQPPELDTLHDRVTSLLEAVIDRFGAAGLDGVMFCEDLGTQDRLLIGPSMWRRVHRPLYLRLTACAHAHGMKVIQHSCGYNWQLIDDLCAAGIDCLQFDQPAVYDQPALAAKLRQHGVGLYSPCDIQQVLPTGDRARIEAATERLVATFRGGFIAKNYPDLKGIGVAPEWDQWAYEAFLRAGAPALAP